MMARAQRHQSSMLCASVLLIVLHFSYNLFCYENLNDNLSPVQRLGHRRLQEQEAPTLPPTPTPIYVMLEENSQQRDFESESSSKDSLSNDPPRQVNWSVTDNEHLSQNDKDDGAKRLAIIAVTLASVFSVLMMISLALVWRKYLWNDGSMIEEEQEEGSHQDDFVVDASSVQQQKAQAHKPQAGGGGLSILRNGESMVEDYNPGRRVRFQLPGSSSSVDRDVISSAECGETPPMGQPRRRGISEEPRNKKIKISEEATNRKVNISVQERPLESGTDPVDHTLGANKPPEKAAIPPWGEVVNPNGPETWANRIMHPWMSSPHFKCCPENWYNCGDQSTIAANSFESSASQANDTSSVTPILPPFPTSTFDSRCDDGDKHGNEEDDEVARDAMLDDTVDKYQFLEDGDVETTGAVLGIMGRDAFCLEDDDDGLMVLEEPVGYGAGRESGVVAPPPRDEWYDGEQVIPPTSTKRNKAPSAAVFAQPPSRDEWYDGDERATVGVVYPTSNKRPKVHSSWRKRAWVPVREAREYVVDTGSLEDEFDIESFGTDFGSNVVYEPRSSSKRHTLVEI